MGQSTVPGSPQEKIKHLLSRPCNRASSEVTAGFDAAVATAFRVFCHFCEEGGHYRV
jgi:hypothetical protein